MKNRAISRTNPQQARQTNEEEKNSGDLGKRFKHQKPLRFPAWRRWEWQATTVPSWGWGSGSEYIRYRIFVIGCLTWYNMRYPEKMSNRIAFNVESFVARHSIWYSYHVILSYKTTCHHWLKSIWYLGIRRKILDNTYLHSHYKVFHSFSQ